MPDNEPATGAVLNALTSDYDRAEITVAWVHDRSTSQHVIVFAVAELCPVDQPSSPTIGDPTHKQLRVSLAGVRSLYLRREAVTIPAALAFFRGAETGRTLPGMASSRVVLSSAASLRDVTADEESVLIPPNLSETAGIGAVLPRRATSVGVLSKYDTGGATERWLGADLQAVAHAVRHALDVDLVRFHEHLGAVHLCFANPILRRFGESITSDERSLLVRCYERIDPAPIPWTV